MRSTIDKIVMDETKKEEIRQNLLKKRTANRTWVKVTATVAAAAAALMMIPFTRNKILQAAENLYSSFKGKNGGEVTLTLKNQDIEGDLVIDNISTLELKMINSKFTGKINNGKTALKMAITLDADSKITLTGDSYYTSLKNADSKGNNIDKGNYKFMEYDSSSQKWIKVSMILLVLLFL